MNQPSLGTKIVRLKELYQENEDLGSGYADSRAVAKESEQNKIKVKRKDGQELEVTEGDLWKEIKYLGRETEGYEVLKQKYPKAFDLGEAQQAKAKEIEEYGIRELGINPFKLRIIDFINLVEMIIDYREEQKAK